MTTMRAYVTVPGSPVPTLEDRPVPSPGADELLVRVEAAALNNGDLAPVDDRRVPGFELAGRVVEVGDHADPDLVGTRVMGIAEGAFAEHAVVHRRHVLPVPGAMTSTAAATLPTALTTEYGAARRAGVHPGDAVLLTAATSGIALVGLQVVRVLGATTVIGTTRSADRRQLLARAGVDHVVVTDEQDLARRTRDLTGGHGVDVTLDHVAGPLLDQAVASTRTGGSVVSVGRLSGPTAEIDLFALARRAVRLQSVSYGLTPASAIGDLVDGVTTDLLPALREGDLRPVVDSVHPFDQLGAALDRLRSGRAEGKVALHLT